MNATSYQVKVLQAACANKFRSRDERLEAVGDILGVELTSFSELTSLQADELISFFKTGKFPENKTWAIFDKANAQHRTILSRSYTLGWRDVESGYADLNRLGGWLKSNRSPVQKPLKEMNRMELSKVIKALDSMVMKKYSV
jgi:hypothetical protein